MLGTIRNVLPCVRLVSLDWVVLGASFVLLARWYCNYSTLFAHN
jgi:hypothetical protein